MLSVIVSVSDVFCFNNMLKASLQDTSEMLESRGDYPLDIQVVEGNSSIFSNYNLGMEKSRYPIKVFIHQDVHLLDTLWVDKVINAFFSFPSCGLIGLVGTTKLFNQGMWWESGNEHIFGTVLSGKEKADWSFGIVNDPVEVECVDGFFLATNTNIKWDTELTGFHLYDLDYSREIKKAGYTIMVIPHKAWHIGEIRESTPNFNPYYKKWGFI